MRLHRGLIGLVVAGLLTVTGASAAWADSPVDLGAAHLVDGSGVLSTGDATQVRDAIDTYNGTSGADLRVVFVKTFTNPSDRTAWAQAVERRAVSPGKTLVLAVATQERDFGFWAATDFPLSQGEVQQVATKYLVPQFRNDRWAAGVKAFAGGLQSGASGSSGSNGGTAAARPRRAADSAPSSRSSCWSR